MMPTSLERIANKARKQKKHRFGNLFKLLNEELLRDCWTRLNKNAALGVDKVSYQEYDANLSENLRSLVERLKEKRYRARLIRRCCIPKGNGKSRKLGIPATEDKLLQYAAAKILQAIFEEDFLPNMFGYRPNRNAHSAIAALQTQFREGCFHHVVEADVKGFFDNIDHGWMVKMLEERINDSAFIWLIKKWLKAGVLDITGLVISPTTGTPQGGLISPILSNIYMHYVLNLWFERIFRKGCRGKAYLCIYADDFVVAFECKEDAERFYACLGERLGKFGLALAAEKTNLILFSRSKQLESKTFDFLGFEFRWRKHSSGRNWMKCTTSPKKVRASLRSFRTWCRENRHTPVSLLFKDLNAKLRGYNNYYGISGNWDGLASFHFKAISTLFRSLNRRSQMRSYNKRGFEELLKTFKVERPRIRRNPQMLLPFSC